MKNYLPNWGGHRARLRHGEQNLICPFWEILANGRVMQIGKRGNFAIPNSGNPKQPLFFLGTNFINSLIIFISIFDGIH